MPNDTLRRGLRPAGRALVAALGLSPALAAQEGPAPPAPWYNPYFPTTRWKVWRDDPTPVPVVSLRREGNEERPYETTLALVAEEKRTYPRTPPSDREGPYVVFASGSPGGFAGLWDDVYASWSGLHGYARAQWRGVDGSQVDVLDQLVHFVDVRKDQMLRAGVNFVHQSTTGMGHAISNGVLFERTRSFEELYFADLLVTAPAHASFSEDDEAFTQDLYIGHVPTLLHSVGSSNSETMAITKLAIVGAYLPAETKRLLKRHGLYPSALLALWKAALPFDVPYDHELRHRIAYEAVGDRETYPGGYGAAGIERGDRSLAYHRYDDGLHMRAMVDLARRMVAPPPEALFELLDVEGGKLHYALRKSAVVLQRAGEHVVVTVSTRDSYDLRDAPLALHWRLLYGNDRTRVVRDADDPHRWRIDVPWDEALPEGRTALGLFASDGTSVGNPAILTVYRQRGELPPSGHGPGDYAFPTTHANRRPVLLDLQDAIFPRGRLGTITWRAVDPEGFPVRFERRANEVGELAGSTFAWRPDRRDDGTARTLTVIASDGTSGNSYAGRRVTLHVEPPDPFAHIEAPVLVGSAPLTLGFSGKRSNGRRLAHGWDVHRVGAERTAPAFEALVHGRELTHTFAEPGVFEVALTVRNAAGEHTQRVRVLVRAAGSRPAAGGLVVRGFGVRLGGDDRSPTPFDGTHFGAHALGSESLHRFTLANASDEPLRWNRRSVQITGEGADAFRVVGAPEGVLEPLATTVLDVRFRPREVGELSARLAIDAGAEHVTFRIAGHGLPR